MPFIRVTVADPDLQTRTAEALARDITSLVGRVLELEPWHTVVHVHRVSRSGWFVGGQGLAGAAGVHCEVSIPAGTTPHRKADLLRGAQTVIAAHLAVPSDAVYLAIHELDGGTVGAPA